MLQLPWRSRHFSLGDLPIYCLVFILFGAETATTSAIDSTSHKHAVLENLEEISEECVVDSGQPWHCSILQKRLVQTDQVDGEVERRVTSPAAFNFLDKMMLSSNLSSNWSSQFESEQISSSQRKNRISKFDMYYFAQVDTRGNPPGEIFIGGKLYWYFQPANAKVDSFMFRILVWPVGNESRTLSMDVKLWRDNQTAVNPQRHTIKSYILLYNRPPLPKPFAFGRSYNLKVELVKEESAAGSADLSDVLAEIASEDGENAAASLMMEFPPSYASSDRSKCKVPALSSPNPREVWMRKRMASRWKSSFDQLKFHEFQPSVTVTFFAAPASYCIEQYLLELRLQNALTVQQKYVSVDELESPHRGSISPIRRVQFDNLQTNANYTVRLTPISMTAEGQCVCEYNRNHHCDCVYVNSPMFTYLGFGAVIAAKYKESNLDADILLTTKEIVNVNSNDSAWLYVVMAMAFLILTLVLLSLALLLRLLRNTAAVRKRNLLLVYNSNRSSGQSEGSAKPLIQTCQSVLLVSLEPRNAPAVDYLAKNLEAAGVKVHYCRWEQDRIEQNMQLWVHQVLTQSDKILLFHEARTLQLLSEKSRHLVEENVFDDVLHAIHSNLVYTDPRIIHVKWCAEQPSLFCRPENVFLLPRDLKLIFTSLRVNVKPDQARRYQDEFAAATAKMPSEKAAGVPSHVNVLEPERKESPLVLVRENGIEEDSSNHTEYEQIDEYGSDSGLASNSTSQEHPIEEIRQNGSATASNTTPLYITSLQTNNNKDATNGKGIAMTHLERDSVNHTEDSGIVA